MGQARLDFLFQFLARRGLLPAAFMVENNERMLVAANEAAEELGGFNATAWVAPWVHVDAVLQCPDTKGWVPAQDAAQRKFCILIRNQ